MERFFYPEIIGDSKLIEITDEEAVHKIVHVLRMNEQSPIVIFDGLGKEYSGKIEKIDKKKVEIQIDGENIVQTEPSVKVILYPALFKKQRFEWMLEKCTELGVNEIIPIKSQRSVVDMEYAPARWQKIVIEAAQQSGRTLVPKIHSSIKLDEALENIKPTVTDAEISYAPQIVVASESEPEQNFPSTMQNINFTKPVYLFVGPEGGWTSDELESFNQYQATKINLGKRILRSETACIALSTLFLYPNKDKQNI